MEAARARGVPILRLDDVSRVQLGEGVHARRIRKAATDVTGFLAEQTSTDKAYTKQLWSQLGIPVPAGRIVVDADDAVRAAEELGWPVVVKPLDADYGNGVTLNVVNPQGVRDGYDVAREESESVLVERSLSGALYRFLIVDDRVVSAVRRDPPGIIGDARRSIRELVDAENQSPRRGPDERWPMHRMSLEREKLAFLAEHGLSPDSVPPAGQRVDLRRESYIMAGGETREVLDRVHPLTLDVVRDAVRVVGLDIAGVDLIARDITRPLDEHGGGLLELNAQPAICLHLAPFCDNPQPVGEAIVASLFPTGATGRIPLALVVGDYPDPAELRPLTRALGVLGQTVAVSTPDVTQVLGRQLSPVTARPADRLDAMYRHPRTAAACLATTAAAIMTQGLGTDHCRLLVLADSGRTNFGGPHSTADLARLLPQLLAMTEACLINLDDPVWQTLVEPCEPSFVLAASDISHPVLQRHLQGGGRIALRDGRDVMLRTRAGELARTRLPTAAAEGIHHWLIAAAALLIERTRSRSNHVALARPGRRVSNKSAKPQPGRYV